jgi:peptidoglycan/xylan/chitin deacetylase (PgdA/CDA1 family)/glycosyltransferase involved in cell wall biosynthesis/SAM-dependent methyltransferase
MTRGRIAVAITCHNLGRHLLEALASVERQTRPAAEIIVVDDGSTETYTRQVLARLEGGGTRVVHAAGVGVCAARNLAARLTSAEYLTWLDGDDLLEPGYFAAAAERLDTDPAIDFVSCALRAFGAANYVWSPSAPTFLDAVSTGGVPHASTIMRRRLWEKTGGFDESLRSFELLDFWATAIEHGFRGVILSEPLLNYRVRRGSGYRRSIQTKTYLDRLGRFYQKHHAAVAQHALELIQAKEDFFLSQRVYWQTLEARSAALQAELADLNREIAQATVALESRGSARVAWGDLRRVAPVSESGGRDRGTTIDQYYVNGFLDAHRDDIKGRVLEHRDRIYTRRFGGDNVTASDVLDGDAANPHATVIADLRRATDIAAGTYDCVILTQTLQLIDDIGAAIAQCARMLRPGGVLLATVPCVARIDGEGGPDGDFWRLTEASARKLFAEAFPVDAFTVRAYGNVMACTALLHGLSVEELSRAELDHVDAGFPLVIGIRAVKPAAASLPPATVTRSCPAAILAYHRIATLAPDSHALCTPPELFRAHMTYLRDNFLPMSLDDLVTAAAAGRIPEGAVAVTLDDGYLDALEVASPILVELGVPATFFVNTDRLGEEHERWWDILEQVFANSGSLPPSLTLTAGPRRMTMPTATALQCADALVVLNRSAWPLDASAREHIVEQVLAWSGVATAARPSHRVVTATELCELAGRPGHGIGGHTTHHLALTTQPAETKRDEISGNRATLEQVLNRPVQLFSYPYGNFDADTIAAVRGAGYRAAVTVEAGLVTAGANRLILPRNEITSRDGERFPERIKEIFGSG